ncbi:MAG: tetratricopeptide repeat protein [Rhizobiaceae bacterium]
MTRLLKVSGINLAIAAVGLMLIMPSAMAGGATEYEKARGYFESGDYHKAAVMLERAVEQGHSAARLPLAAMYREGMGVDQNLQKAVALFTVSAKEGYPSAQFTLGALYRAGEGVEVDYKKALKWFFRAARQGEVDSQNNLGTMFEAGRGVRSSQATALMWYEIASANGSRRAGDNYKRLKRKLSEEQVLKAKKLVHTCLQSNYRKCGGR